MNFYKNYFQEYPVTSLVILVNAVIFLLIKLGIIPPFFSTPANFDLNSLLSNFSHYGGLHFLFNMLITFQISPLIERKIRGISYLILILILAWGTTLGVVYFSVYPTLGFSGIALGMMTFAAFLYSKNKAVFNQLSIWVLVNIGLGLMPGVSFIGHLFGALTGLFIFLILKVFSPQILD